MSPERSFEVLALDPTLTRGWVERLNEPHRHYHTATHIAHMLAHVGPAPTRELLAAIWLHDIVYDPRATDNEERSAELAGRDLRDTAIDIDEVKNLIMVTKHHVPAAAESEAMSLMVDLDVLILSEPSLDYDRYADQIRQEYCHVPTPIYATKRAQILTHFLTAPAIYRSAAFSGREARARANLKREIAVLNSLR